LDRPSKETVESARRIKAIPLRGMGGSFISFQQGHFRAWILRL